MEIDDIFKNHLRIFLVKLGTIFPRHYQKHAIASVCEKLSNIIGDRYFWLSTGGGKTRIQLSLVDILSRHNWVKNTFSSADRTSLGLSNSMIRLKLLPDLSVCNFLEDKEGAQSSRMVFYPYPTMIGAISGQEEVNQRPFTVGHFDLIIIDESHRFLFKKYKSPFYYILTKEL